MTWSIHGQPVRSVLVSRLRYLGDIAMSSVVLEALRSGDPDLVIDYLCEAEYAPLLQQHPHLNRVLALAVRRSGHDARTRRSGHAGANQQGLSSPTLVRELRRTGYQLGVDLFFNPRSAWLLRLGGVRRRIGGSRSWRRRLYSHTVHPPDRRHHGDFWALAPGGLGDHLGRLSVLRHEETDLPFLDWLSATRGGERFRTRVAKPSLEGTRAQAALAELGITPTTGFILLAPGSTWPAKEWPAENWRALMSLLAAESPLPLVVLTPPSRQELYGRLGAELPAGRSGVLPFLDLSEALRVVAAASLLVCVDGGIMHAAVAMGRPTLALFGPTAPDIWFPYEGAGAFQVLATRPACHPCDLHECDQFICLPELSPQEVSAAVRNLLHRLQHGSGASTAVSEDHERNRL